MEHDKKTLHELGFGNTSRKKKESKKRGSNKLPTQPPTSTTLERIQERFWNQQNSPSPDAPPDTGIGGSGHDDLVDKGESGFKSYMGEWKEGYPR